MLGSLGLTCDEFCKDWTGTGHADQLIGQHDRFGDTYFRLSESLAFARSDV